MFVPHKDVTVDEQLVPFRENSSLRTYMPSKPRGKYGITLWSLSEVKTAYICHAPAYTRKPENGARETNQGRNIVLRLTHKLDGSGRSITTDNFFTDYTLETEILKKKSTLVGTLRKNMAFIPQRISSTPAVIKLSILPCLVFSAI